MVINEKPVLIEEEWKCKCGSENIMYMGIPLGYLKSYNSVDMLCQDCWKPRVHAFNFTDVDINKFEALLQKKDRVHIIYKETKYEIQEEV